MQGKYKKGVSGLIVAVLLLAVALTIGGLVMGWISGYTDDNLGSSSSAQKKQDECFDRDYKVISVNATGPGSSGVPSDGNATIILENKNDESIKGFLFKFVTSDDALYAFEAKNSTDSLSAYVRNTYYFDSTTLNTASGTSFLASTGNYNVTKVEILPIIDIVVDTTEEVVCTSKLKTVEDENFVS